MRGELSEETLTMTLPIEKDWVWRGDLNMLVFSSRLSPAEREQAFEECMTQVRRSVLRVVRDAGEPPHPEVA